MSSYTKVDNKLLFRIDFRPSLKYYDHMFEIASVLESEYEHWKATHNPAMGVLFDSESKRQVNISSQSISFTTKNEAILRDPYEEISKLVVLFLSENNVAEIRRIGIRRMGIQTVNRTYKEFIDRFFERFYGSQKQLKDITADKLDDVVLVLQGIKEGFNNRNQFGPLKQEEVERLYGVEEFETAPVNLNKKTAVMVDTDLFSVVGTDLDEALAAIKEALRVSEKMHDDSWKLIQDNV